MVRKWVFITRISLTHFKMDYHQVAEFLGFSNLVDPYFP